MKLYKLTNGDGQSYGGTQWGKGITHKAIGLGTGLCTKDVIHAYKSPLLALLLNPTHANISKPQLWEAEGEIVADDGLKVGCKELTTVKRMRVPKITTEHRVRFAILCALEVYDDGKFRAWARAWLDGSDRSKAAAETVARAARAVWPARAAKAAAAAAREAVKAAASKAVAVWAVEAAARAAAWAAVWSAEAERTADIDLIAIAEKACRKGE